MYGKLFVQMYDGTLGTKGPWEALVTFQQMIVLADKAGVVDMTPDALARRTTIPLAIIEQGVAALELPDPDSRSPDEDGRRIVRLSDDRAWGWRIVNYEKYRTIRTEEERREYHKLYARKRRASTKASTNVNTSTDSQQSQPIVVSRKQEVKAKAPTAPADEVFEAFWRSYPKRAGTNPKQDAREQWDARKKFGINPLAMQDGAVRYAKYCEAAGKVGTEFVMQAVRFLGQKNCFFNEPFTLPEKQNGVDPFEAELQRYERDHA